MASLEFSVDAVQSPSHMLGQTFLRAVLGALLLAHGVQRLFALGPFQDELALRFGLLEPGTMAHTLLALELAGGAGLIFGWFTRLSALSLFANACVAFGLELARQGGVVRPHGFELATLLGASALYVLLAGPGPVSLDAWLAARARRKAIENDEMWLTYPYVAQSEDSYDDGFGEDALNPALATRRLGPG